MSRIRFLAEVFWEPWKGVVIVSWSTLNVFDSLQAQVMPEDVSRDLPRFYDIAEAIFSIAPDLNPAGWLAGWAIILLVLGLEGAYRSVRKKEQEITRLRGSESTLEGKMVFSRETRSAYLQVNNLSGFPVFAIARLLRFERPDGSRFVMPRAILHWESPNQPPNKIDPFDFSRVHLFQVPTDNSKYTVFTQGQTFEFDRYGEKKLDAIIELHSEPSVGEDVVLRCMVFFDQDGVPEFGQYERITELGDDTQDD